MNWNWWYIPLFLGTVMLLWVLDVLRDIRDSLRHIEETLVRIPGDADQRSEVMAIAIPNSCRSRFRDDGDHCSDGKPITFRRSSEWRSASSESFS